MTQPIYLPCSVRIYIILHTKFGTTPTRVPLLSIPGPEKASKHTWHGHTSQMASEYENNPPASPTTPRSIPKNKPRN